MSFSPAAPIPPWHRLGWDARSRGHEWITFDLAADGSVERLRPTVFVPDELARLPRSEGLPTISTGSFYGDEPAPNLSAFAARGILGQTWQGQIEWTREGRVAADI
jgi:hypothetical protein